MATSYYESFVKKLEEIFMMNHAELDFGIYRIMNQKRSEIKQFLEKNLLTQVKDILAAGNTEAEALKLELVKAIDQCHQVGMDPEQSPKVQDIKKRMASTTDTAALENNVYSHLTTFFSRYYDEGDFISKRRYKDNTYAIPYNGEEVKLHWANADQYYIKTSEYFQNYSFRLPDRRKAHFVLRDASTEQNNNKTQNNQERRFALYTAEGEPTVEVVDGELNIYFTYELMAKTAKQKDLNAQAVATLRQLIPADWGTLLQPVSTTDSRPLIEKHINDYTAKNSFDYFIHKDLGTFLRRELDFYIKNEVMLLDDLDTAHIQSQLSTVKAIKGVGEKIIRMLAQIEDFQKRLWLKKKFVVQTDYCITLDRVPRELYADICANDRQRSEWVRLFAIDDIKGDMVHEGYSEPLTEQFLEENPFLVLDTQFFSADFKHRLLASIDNIDEQCNGLLINSENFQALELLQEKYQGGVKCIYIDPPYNTSENGFTYKNQYKHSSWISMMNNRIETAYTLTQKSGVVLTAIDDTEYSNLRYLLEKYFGKNNYIGTVAVEVNPAGQNIRPNVPARCHDYFHAFAKNIEDCDMQLRGLSQEEIKQYSERDEHGAYYWDRLRRRGGNSRPSDRPKQWFPIFRKGKELRVPSMRWDNINSKWEINDTLSEGEVAEWPIDPQGENRIWRVNFEGAIKGIANGEIEVLEKAGKIEIYKKSREPEGKKPKTMWYESKYSATSYGSKLLIDLFGGTGDFSYPKSINLVSDCIFHWSIRNCIILDYFAGSGTTGHAVINLNREDNGNRKYILCEMAEYFKSVTKPRIQKVIYSKDWKNGKPVSRKGVSQCFKYIRLEQYEDTLNNLVVAQLDDLFSTADDKGFKESYMLGYMMDTETRGSLFNMEWFTNPFAMTLKTTKDNELVETAVDMVETFNFLIGLRVETEHWHMDGNICVVEGVTHRNNETALVIWRNCEKVDNDALNRFFCKMDYSTLAHDFDVIYVNGDNTLPNLRRDDDRWKVVLIEEEFKNRMFEEE